MHEPNVQRLLQIIQPGWKVLDIGGWACPFNRATHVMDAERFETRGYYAKIGKPAFQGPAQEHFTAATWIQRDICGREPYPFKDKELDFVTCSHTLEDIRDPLWVCSEMVRISRRGYVEIPSRLWETCRGTEHPRLAGLSHHRWLIEITGAAARSSSEVMVSVTAPVLRIGGEPLPREYATDRVGAFVSITIERSDASELVPGADR